MCTVCGCGNGEARIGHAQAHHHHDHHHHHHRHHHHGTDDALTFSGVPGLERGRMVRIEEDILAANDAVARRNRQRLRDADVLALNLVSSPGAGKTTLLVETLQRLTGRRVAVIEGDQETSADAGRIRATGAPAIQINTGKGCHLDAAMVESALDHLELPRGGILFIENVGNLVCPAGFDLGEAHKVVVASVTEGEDKPLKYPGMFQVADLVLIAKLDLLPHLDFDLAALVDNARRVNPRLDVIQVSARAGLGMPAWLAWLDAAAASARAAA